MKSIKNLNIKTKEGFEIKNYSRFPSHEWGDEGGCKADVYYKGAYVGNMYNDGEGGEALFTFDNSIDNDTRTKIKTDLLLFLKRKDENYKKYVWLKTKTPDKVNGDDFDALVVQIEMAYFSKRKVTSI